MEPNQDGSEVLETTEKVAEETTETPEELTAEQIAELKAKAAKADELEKKNKQLFERAKKAETEKAPLQEEGLSNRDVLYLAKADVHEDDVDEVLDWAKFKKISVAYAHKQLKATLDVRAEQRKSASASHTKGGARGTSKTTGEDLLRKAERTGEVPETAEGMNDLFLARQKRRLEN
jgi:hypothetical protein